VRRGQLPDSLPDKRSDEIGRLSRAFNEMVRQLKRRDAETTRLSASLRRESDRRGKLLKRLITAQEDERRRVARELHDELGQHLTGLTFRADVLGRFIGVDPGRAQKQLCEIRALSTQATDRMYDLILDLRPSVLDDLGLVAALKVHAERMLEDTGIEFRLEAQSMKGRLPEELETALYRMFQEALSNAVRHSAARHVDIRMARSNGVFEADIVDDGCGFDPDTLQFDGHSPRGLGLLGMRERVTLCGGGLDIISRPGKGTRLHIRIPVAMRHDD
jgi:signal transduction histidine kinase